MSTKHSSTTQVSASKSVHFLVRLYFKFPFHRSLGHAHKLCLMEVLINNPLLIKEQINRLLPVIAYTHL